MPLNPANNVEIQDEGVSQGFVRTINFTNTGVTAVVSGSTATVDIPSGGAGSVDIKAATITAPYESYDYSETVVDAAVSGASQLILSWGATTDDDENTPDMEDVNFSAVAGTGNFVAKICSPNNNLFGGPFKLNYLIG